MEIRTSNTLNRMTPLWAVGFYDDLRPHVTGCFGIGARLFSTEEDALAHKDGTIYTILDFYVRTEGDRDALISQQKAAQDRHVASLEDWFK